MCNFQMLISKNNTISYLKFPVHVYSHTHFLISQTLISQYIKLRSEHPRQQGKAVEPEWNRPELWAGESHSGPKSINVNETRGE